MDSHFTWTGLIPVVGYELSHVVYATMVALFLLFIALLGKRALLSSKEISPEEKPSLKNFFEVFLEQVTKLSDSVVGPQGRFMIPFFCYIFLFIWVQNLLCLVPGFLSATQNVNTTIALGAFSFLGYNYYGFKEHGISYLKQFLGPVFFMAPLFLFIEVLSHLFRPLSLGLRLFGNMEGDHVVIGIFLELVPWLVPIIFYFLGLFVCTLQAFVFTILTMVYVSLAISHDH